jgi:hypothetical protein
MTSAAMTFAPHNDLALAHEVSLEGFTSRRS